MNEEEFRALEAKVDALVKKKNVLEEQTEWLEGQLQEKDDKIDQLKQRVDSLEDTTQLLDNIQAAGSRKPTERAALLIQTLHQRAQASNGKASLDVQGALDVLRLDKEKRTLMYTTFEEAEKLADDEDVLWYRTESRSSSKKSRLILDLNQGDLPETAEGHELRAEGD